MRYVMLVLAGIAAALLPAAAVARPIEGPWKQDGERLTLPAADLSVPTKVGSLPLTEAREFSHPGEAIDNVAQYKSADGEVFPTVYVYFPGLAHSGLSALATAKGMKTHSPKVESKGVKLVSAGDRTDAAVREDFTDYRNGLVSSAAFIKSGPWIVKLRVSGPEARKDEVMAAMDGLLSGLRFGPKASVRAASIVAVTPCPAAAPAEAKLLPDEPEAVMAEAVALGALDGAGLVDRKDAEARVILARVGARFCEKEPTSGQADEIPILRAVGDEQGGLARSVVLALVSDSGGVLEVAQLAREGTFRLLYHQIGSTALLGSYDKIPSDEQIRQILSGADADGGRFRAEVIHRPGKGDQINVLLPAAAPVPTT